MLKRIFIFLTLVLLISACKPTGKAFGRPDELSVVRSAPDHLIVGEQDTITLNPGIPINIDDIIIMEKVPTEYLDVVSINPEPALSKDGMILWLFDSHPGPISYDVLPLNPGNALLEDKVSANITSDGRVVSVNITGDKILEIYECDDSDDDGYYAISSVCPIGTDCDDDNPVVKPNNLETCDGLDNDCDGTVDEGVRISEEECARIGRGCEQAECVDGEWVLPICVDLCGDGVCQEVVCMAQGCPCAETVRSCPEDCAKSYSYTFDSLSGNKLMDSSGKADAETVGRIKLKKGIKGNAGSFDGRSGALVDIPLKSDITIETSVYPKRVSGPRIIVAGDNWRLFRYSDRLYYQVSDRRRWRSFVTGSFFVDGESWYDIKVVRKGDKLEIYKDGKQFKTFSKVPSSPSKKLYIGFYKDQRGRTGFHWYGLIDELMIYEG